MENTECDNYSSCHNPVTLSEDNFALRVFCKDCKHQYILRKDWRGVVENREYSKIFKRDILQPRENLFYKIYPRYLRT